MFKIINIYLSLVFCAPYTLSTTVPFRCGDYNFSELNETCFVDFQSEMYIRYKDETQGVNRIFQNSTQTSTGVNYLAKDVPKIGYIQNHCFFLLNLLNSTFFKCVVLKCNQERGCFRRDLELYQITLYSENKIDLEIGRPVAYKSISGHLRRLKDIFLPVVILCIVIIFLACLILFVNIILCMKTSRRLEKKEDKKIQQTTVT